MMIGEIRTVWKLLMGMRACGLKNDALMETFYEIVGEHYQADEDYAIYVFHDRYDIPAGIGSHTSGRIRKNV